jgi:hypothetical protein
MFSKRIAYVLLLAVGCGSDSPAQDEERGCPDAGCDPGQYCDTSDSQSAPTCRDRLPAEAACDEDGQCGEGLICEVTCRDPSDACVVGTTTCVDGAVETCTGRGFTTDRLECADDTVCAQLGSADATCMSPICTPDERRCSDAHSVSSCDELGFNEVISACDASQLCGDGECADSVVERTDQDGTLGGVSRTARDAHLTVIDVTESRLLQGFDMSLIIDEPLQLGWVVYEDTSPSDDSTAAERIFYVETNDTSGPSDMELPLLAGHRYALGIVPLGDTEWAVFAEDSAAVQLSFGTLIGSHTYVADGSAPPTQLEEELEENIWEVNFTISALPAQ